MAELDFYAERKHHTTYMFYAARYLLFILYATILIAAYGLSLDG